MARPFAFIMTCLLTITPLLAQSEDELKDLFNRKKAENRRHAPPEPKRDPAKDTEAQQRMQLQLESKLGEMRFAGAPLGEVIDRLRTLPLNIYVNWLSLETCKIDKKTPVTIDLSHRRTCEALDALLQRVGGEKTPLSWGIEERYVVAIRTRGEFSENLTRTYDLPAGADVATIVRRIKGLDPLSWQDNGGTVGTIIPDGSKLIVTHNSRVHELIRQELEAPTKTP